MNTILENLKSGKYQVVDNQGISVTQHFIQCLEKEFADLEAKLAESKEQVEIVEKQHSELLMTIFNGHKENFELKQQLAEKKKETKKLELMLDKVLTELHTNCYSGLNIVHFKEMMLNDLGGAAITYNQDKIEFVIAELEKLLEKTQILDVLHQSGHYINQKKVNVVFKGTIDQRIKELKEGK